MDHHHLNSHLLANRTRQGGASFRVFSSALETEHFRHVNGFALIHSESDIIFRLEFGDDFVLNYQPEKAKKLSHFIESQRMVYEAHSTDHQTREALKDLGRDHFAILKVGPGLTFAFREAVFALAMIENELIPKDQRSHIIEVLDDVMVRHPEHWKKYYRGDETEQAVKRKYSLSDRARYYWIQPEVQDAYVRLIKNLRGMTLPYSLLSQFAGVQDVNSDQFMEWKIDSVLKNYQIACNDL